MFNIPQAPQLVAATLGAGAGGVNAKMQVQQGKSANNMSQGTYFCIYLAFGGGRGAIIANAPRILACLAA